MTEPVTIDQLRAHVRPLEGDAEDNLLRAYALAARRAIEHATDRVIVGDDADVDQQDMLVVEVAIMQLVAHWYMTREAVSPNAAGAKVPMTVEYLIAPLARLAV